MQSNNNPLKNFLWVIWFVLIVVIFSNILALDTMAQSYALSWMGISLCMLTPVVFLIWAARKIVLLVEYKRSNRKESEKLQYQMQTYRSLESAKYEIEKNSHRLMRIVALLESENLQNSQLVEELSKIKVILKEEGYYINTGNVIFDYLITNKIKTTYDFDTFKSVIALSEKEKYDRKEFISTIESLIDLYRDCVGVEMNLYEKNNFVICDMCHSGGSHPDYLKWQSRHCNYECDVIMDEANRQHFKVIIE